MKLVACNSCGWVHMGMHREAVEAQILQFNKFYGGAGRLHLNDFKQCFRCRGSFLNLRIARLGDCSEGGPIQAILLSPELEHDNPS